MTESSTATGGQQEAPKLDTNVPHSARIWNYWLGGKDNFAADRAVGDRVREAFPEIVEIARAARAFQVRALGYLVGEAGVRQFLDIGTGLPTADNTHEVAQRLAPKSRIVYVDNDPLVLVHARALLTSSPEGATDYIDADVHEPDKILQAATQTLDFTQSIGVMMSGILGYVAEYDEARSIVRRLLDAVPSGSYLLVVDGVMRNKEDEEAFRARNVGGGVPYIPRSPEQFAQYFDGLDLVEPGVVSTRRWRPEPSPSGLPAEWASWCGVGRKP